MRSSSSHELHSSPSRKKQISGISSSSKTSTPRRPSPLSKIKKNNQTTAARRRWKGLRETESLSPVKTSNGPSNVGGTTYQWDRYGPRFLQGLTLCGVGAAVLSTLFGLFHVDVFLRTYDLPLASFATGSLLMSGISTANDFFGAWLVDAIAANSGHRSELLGLSGCLLSVAFLSPFFPWWSDIHNGRAKGSSPSLPTTSSQTTNFILIHFITTTTLYDIFQSFTSVLLGSLVTDNHEMSDSERVRFMMSGKVANLVVSFVVSRIALEIFDAEDLANFQEFLLILCLVVCLCFVIGQVLMDKSRAKKQRQQQFSSKLSRHSRPTRSWEEEKMEGDDSWSDSSKKRKVTPATIHFRRVASDLWNHSNFCAFVTMEVLLECQNSFLANFLKTFVDRLIMQAQNEERNEGYGPGLSKDTAEWLLSVLPPLKQVAAILCYIPIRRRGYKNVYTGLFVLNFALASLCCFAVVGVSNFSGDIDTRHAPYYCIVAFLVLYFVCSGAVQDAGFHLAMSDMVLEMKHNHVVAGRFDEPSLAGLFMGANALLCKPMNALLPLVTATLLNDHDLNQEESSHRTKKALFCLLVGPPLVFSIIQFFAWRRYVLTPSKVAEMKDNLKILVLEQENADEERGP